ncbi:acetyl/propionyl/methylcrotonyl-CoA carboxylase subunit alpha [Methylocella silvestris]|uniref:Methylcrotonoyl-CoA carboxylase n=1 Tax=Methylocella silvestris TaxID=199596 RepID=A0A2J7TG05_METSI|nr:acetyl/propionyl/methylcrotonyl-CoA carboxylase subunit alpha [Methylocella silvestris]PNG25679.1 methylcrotonoyl-CoA carboxylase [Methylocella silvestris]
MIGSLLIANRGEIACRIIRTARRLGVRTLAVFSEADCDALHVRLADQAVCLGGATARDSYLAGDKIIEAAIRTGTQAIHPGYGFLSENAEFAEAVEHNGLIWVGPPAAAIRAMGLKDAAKARMLEAGVPVTPGYLGEDQSEKRLAAEAEKLGFPVLIKAVAGGGGKGMRKVERIEDFLDALALCRREAGVAFGDQRVMLETYVQRPRHIEVQLFADCFGNVVHLFERDCSLQRRHQKVIEEAPAPDMPDEARAVIHEAAVRAARAIGYRGAGTVEFIADSSKGLRADAIYFMEMNTRLQVEHPVTEMVTGQDLVEWQLRVASGEALPLRQEQITLSGYSIEARLYAEDPLTGFLPSIGPLQRFRTPARIRVDAGVEEGGEVTPLYDPMIAKLIVHAPTRKLAAERLADATARVEVWPVKTNAGFLTRALRHPDFVNGKVHTGFIAEHLDALLPNALPSDEVLLAGAAASLAQTRAAVKGPLSGIEGFRLNGAHVKKARLVLGRKEIVVPVDRESALATLAVADQIIVFEDGQAFTFDTELTQFGEPESDADGTIIAPMPGRIVALATTSGASVKKGQLLITLEAMKMEHAMKAPFDGVVDQLGIEEGEQVKEGMLLIALRRTDNDGTIL